MSIDITLSLQEQDLDYFRNIMRQGLEKNAGMSEDEVIANVKKLAGEARATAPEFLIVRLAKLETMVDMVEDAQWQIPAEEREDVIHALAYFCDAEDLIPDNIPTLGFLDDAIMVDLVAESLKENMDAFNEFCAYREREKKRRDPASITSDDWLAAKRRELHNRMRHRRGSRRFFSMR